MTKREHDDMKYSVNLDEYQPRMSFSEYVHKDYNAIFTNENPETSAKPLYNQDMNIFWPTFADWAIANPKMLPTIEIMYLMSIIDWIFDVFSIERTEKSTIVMNRFRIDRNMVPVSTRKTPARIISSTMSTTQKHLELRGQGFSVDKYHMQTPDGRANYDAHIKQVYANIIASVKLATLHTFAETPEFYRMPDQLYAFKNCIPTSPEQVYEFDQTWFGCLNKETIGFNLLASQVSTIMGREKNDFDRLILTRDDFFFITSKDASRLYVPFAGPDAITNRKGNPNGLMDIQFLQIPSLDTQNHNDSDSAVLANRVSCGSMWSFFDETIDEPPEAFISCKRDTQVASWATNEMDTYRICDAFALCPQFHQIRRRKDDGDCGAPGGHGGSILHRMRKSDPDKHYSKEGRINREWLASLAANAPMHFRDRRVIIEGNERELDVFLVFNSTLDDRVGWYPVNFNGEVTELKTATKYLRHAYKTMAHSIFKNLSAAELSAFSAGMRLAESFSEHPVSIDDLRILLNKQVKEFTEIDVRSARSKKEAMTATKMQMAPLNEFGGLDLNRVQDQGLVIKYLPGYGNISGILTINKALSYDVGFALRMDPDMATTVRNFVIVYEKVVKNMLNCTFDHLCLDPRMVPYVHDSDKMTDFTRSMIVAWYTVFTTYAAPLYVLQDGPINMNESAYIGGDYKAIAGAVSGGAIHGFEAKAKMFGLADIDSYLAKIVNNIDDITIAQLTTLLDAFKRYCITQKITKSTANSYLEYPSKDNPEYKKEELGGRHSPTGDFAYLFENFSTYVLIVNKLCHYPGKAEVNPAYKRLLTDAAKAEKKTIIVVPLTSSYNTYGTEKVIVQNVYDQLFNGANVSSTNEGFCHHVFLQSYAVTVQLDVNKSDEFLKDPFMSFKTVMTENRIVYGSDTNFPGFGAYTVSDTLLGAAPYINPLLPNQPRGMNLDDIAKRAGISRSWMTKIKTFHQHFYQYTNMYPTARDSWTVDNEVAIMQIEHLMHKEESYRQMCGLFPSLPAAFMHIIIYPLSGNARRNSIQDKRFLNNRDFPDMQRRYIETHAYPLQESIGARVVLFQEPSAQMGRVWYDNNIAIPYNVLKIRPREEQMMHSQIALSSGRIGKLYMNNMASLLSFNPETKHYHYQTELQHGTFIADIEKFHILRYTRGGRPIGGKGNRDYIENTQLPCDSTSFKTMEMDDFRKGTDSGEAMGSVYTNFSVLQGYNAAFERNYQPVYIDITGHSDADDFVGRLTHCREFEERQDAPMFDGVFFFNMVYDWDRLKIGRERVPLDKRSFSDTGISRQINFHCLQTTQRIYCKTKGYQVVKSRHIWGEQVNGCRTKESSEGRVGYLD